MATFFQIGVRDQVSCPHNFIGFLFLDHATLGCIVPALPFTVTAPPLTCQIADSPLGVEADTPLAAGRRAWPQANDLNPVGKKQSWTCHGSEYVWPALVCTFP